ncbi:hypothetical protein [Deinococcus sp.]|uniref:hypothetical protein n=1 Tax=Deinococcus sp. TaxID=47478 RepID=UPI003CC6DD20
MKKLCFILPFVALMSCAPIQAAKPTLYRADSADILAAVAKGCPTVLLNGLYDYFRVSAVTPTAVTCVTTPVAAFQVLLGSVPVSMTFMATQNGQVSAVTGILYRDKPADNDRDPVSTIFLALDKAYNRVPY